MGNQTRVLNKCYTTGGKSEYVTMWGCLPDLHELTQTFKHGWQTSGKQPSTDMLFLLFSGAWQQRRNSPFDSPLWMCTAASGNWSGKSPIMGPPGFHCKIENEWSFMWKRYDLQTLLHRWLTAGLYPYRKHWTSVRWGRKVTEPQVPDVR